MLLGLPTWGLVNAIYGIMFHLVKSQPEAYSISAYVTLALSCGNIVSIICSLLYKDILYAHTATIVRNLLVLGLASGSLLAIFWSLSINNASIPLFLLVFLIGISSTGLNISMFTLIYSPQLNQKLTSSSEVDNEESSHISSVATGMGLGSMMSGLLALILGNTGGDLLEHRASYLISIYLAVITLQYLPSLYVLYKYTSVPTHTRSGSFGGVMYDPIIQSSWRSSSPAGDTDPGVGRDKDKHENHPTSPSRKTSPHPGVQVTLDREEQWLLLLIFGSGLMGFGIIPSVISSVCGRFHHSGSISLLYASTVGCLIDPVSRAATHHFHLQSLLQFGMLFTVSCSITCVLLILLGLPGSNPLFQSRTLCYVPAVLYVLYIASFGYFNTCVYIFINQRRPAGEQQPISRLVGISLQSGAFLGSVVMFAIIASNSV